MGAQAQGGGKGGQMPNMFEQSSMAATGGMMGAAGEMGFQPMMLDPSQYGANGRANVYAQQVGANDMSAAQTTQADIDRFYNPYVGQVVDTSMQDIERARLQQQNAAAAQAQAAGAFGGSRGALMEAEVGRNALEQAAQTAAQLRAQGYSQAANLSQQDVARRQAASQFNAAQALQSALANQGANLQAAQTRAQLGMQGSIASQANALQAALANQGAQLAGSQQRLAAGNQLANIGNLGFNQAQSVQQQMAQQGALQQMLQQQLIQAAQGQYAGYQGFPSQALGYLSQALGSSQIPQNQTTSRQPGLFDYLTLGMFSDIRLKENIRPLGATKSGHKVYEWDWNDAAKGLGLEGRARGVIAQEVMETRPDLVMTDESGYLKVNYGGIH